ncbi:MAG: SGNH/GDSL hydrolase family protein [Acidobacteriaceae bacterium]|nr:SGNH/GDSL hydrolase family protein [Acidobacteriaceae bacterium]
MRLQSIVATLCVCSSLLFAAPPAHWVATWAAAPSPQLPNEGDRAKGHLELDNETIREIVHTSIGGSTIRLRLSNQFGHEPVDIGAVHVGLCAEGAQIVPASDRAVTFSGKVAFTIPANAPFISDPIQLKMPAGSNLCISLFVPKKTTAAGIHYSAQQKNFLAPGDATGAENAPTATSVQSWLFLAGVDVAAPESSAAIVAFGDSITDGAASTVDANRRWPNILADRLLNAHKDLAVVDEGIGGNRILHDAGDKVIGFGVNALARFERDALGQPGAKYIIVLEGINDLGHAGGSAPISEAVTADDLIAGLRQMIERAHEHQLKIFGGTLTPFEGCPFPGYYTPEKEKEREKLNDWIRSSGAFDGVIDFEKAVRDAANPLRMLADYDSGDHLHPNDAGYKAMGDAVNLALFK